MCCGFKNWRKMAVLLCGSKCLLVGYNLYKVALCLDLRADSSLFIYFARYSLWPCWEATSGGRIPTNQGQPGEADPTDVTEASRV
jgi:hypothetical protein